MINVYLYDGSFEGLLTCVYEAYYSALKPSEIFAQHNYIQNLIHNTVLIETDKDKSFKVYNAIKEKIGPSTLRNIFTLYLSEEEDVELLILNYIKLCFKVGKDIDNYIHNDIVLKVIKTCRCVTLEAHRFCGFVRFKALGNNLFYSSIEPDHNILTLIGQHFASRFSSQKWIIHDIKRGIALLYNEQDWVISPLDYEEAAKITKAADADCYENLWKTYYDTTTIKERENPRLRSRMMPRRYWKNILEVIDGKDY